MKHFFGLACLVGALIISGGARAESVDTSVDTSIDVTDAFGTTAVSVDFYRRQTIVDCQSFNYQTTQCFTGLRRIFAVDLINQYSSHACIQGRTFGISGRGHIWVSNGCRGRFAVSGR